MNENFGFTDHEDMEVLATKVSKSGKILLQQLCDKIGCTLYDLQRNCLEALMRYSSDRFNLTPGINKLIRLFDGFKDWNNSINLLNPVDENDIVKAIYIAQQPGRHGLRPFAVGRSILGTREVTFNPQEILDEVLQVCHPDAYKRLVQYQQEQGLSSVSEAIIDLVNELPDTEQDAEIRRMFQDANRGDFGKDVNMEEAGKYKRAYERSMDAMERQEARQTRLFETAMTMRSSTRFLIIENGKLKIENYGKVGSDKGHSAMPEIR